MKFEHLNQYTFGDSVKILETVPDKSVDLVFTSPPDLSQVPGWTPKEFLAWLEIQCGHFSRVIKDDGFVVLSQQDRKVNAEILPIHWHYINWMTNVHGLKLKDEKIMIRNKAERVDLYKFTYQYFSCFTRKGKIPTKKRHGMWLQDIIIDPEENLDGQYIWSIPFCKLVIETLTDVGDFVIDPFAGYGSVLFAANELGRSYWGGELDERRYNENFKHFLGYDPIDIFR
jgi:DNA modification methylase